MAAPRGATELPSDGAELLRSFERLAKGTTPFQPRDLDSGFAAADRLLEAWAPSVRRRGRTTRAMVAEILERGTGSSAAVARSPVPRLAPGSSAQKLGVLLLTARLFEHLQRTGTPASRPTIVVEDPESGLHPMTLAALWDLLEGFSAQKLVTTNSGALLSAAPLRCVRRLTRDTIGVVREWRVREGALRRDELRRVSYHLRARRADACFARCWLLVEGETEFWILPDLARLLGYDLVQEGIACVEFAQCGLAPLVKLARSLGIEWHVLVDGDSAGESYSAIARRLLRGDDEPRRISALAERDIEHCFWSHGHAAAFERLAGQGVAGASPARVIAKAIERHSKPGVAFELLSSVAAGSAATPAPLRRAIETCVALAGSFSSSSCS